MIREGIEDYLRYKIDIKTNAKLFFVLRNGSFVEIRADEIIVGDIIKIKQND